MRISIRPDIHRYISQAEVLDVMKTTEHTEEAELTEIKYAGHGTWMARIYDHQGREIAWKSIPEKPGADGGWNNKERPVGVWHYA